jgi:hypothetical protein
MNDSCDLDVISTIHKTFMEYAHYMYTATTSLPLKTIWESVFKALPEIPKNRGRNGRWIWSSEVLAF